jgi:hypothetical protein
MLKELPQRPMLLREKEDPMWAKSSTDMAEDRYAIP